MRAKTLFPSRGRSSCRPDQAKASPLLLLLHNRLQAAGKGKIAAASNYFTTVPLAAHPYRVPSNQWCVGVGWCWLVLVGCVGVFFPGTLAEADRVAWPVWQFSRVY